MRRELSHLPKSDHSVHRRKLWETCSQRFEQDIVANQRAPLWQHPAWEDLERQRRADRNHVLLQQLYQQQYQRQQPQVYQQRPYQQQQYPRWPRLR